MAKEFICKINMDNASFSDDYDSELSSILRGIADNIEGTSNTAKSIVDSNGNKIGQWEIVLELYDKGGKYD